MTVKVNERFSFEKDTQCWLLHEFYENKGKKGGMSKKTTYHTNLAQICTVIIDRSCDQCESLEEIIKLLKEAPASLLPRIKQS